MIQTLVKNGWLLVLCGVIDAIYSGMNFMMQRPDGSLTLRTFVNSSGTLVNMGVLALAAGICTLAAGNLGFRKGQILDARVERISVHRPGAEPLAFRAGERISFRTIALLVVVMALSIAIYELAAARGLRSHLAAEWLLGAAGAVSLGFASAFLAFALHRIKLDPGSPAQTLHWLGSYFGFAAICMVGLGSAAWIIGWPNAAYTTI